MNITKGEKVYTVKECKSYWSVSTAIGKLTVIYQVPKDMCEILEDLKQYIKSENIF